MSEAQEGMPHASSRLAGHEVVRARVRLQNNPSVLRSVVYEARNRKSVQNVLTNWTQVLPLARELYSSA